MISFSIDPSFRFIRQYYDPMPFTVKLRNDDSIFNVIHYPNLNRKNFNFTLSLSSDDLASPSNRRKRSTSSEGPFLPTVNEDLTAGLSTGENITFTGKFNVMVSKSLCPNFNFFCLKMDPSSQASFELFGSATNMICLNASAYKNCQGKLIILFCIHCDK